MQKIGKIPTKFIVFFQFYFKMPIYGVYTYLIGKHIKITEQLFLLLFIQESCNKIKNRFIRGFCVVIAIAN